MNSKKKKIKNVVYLWDLIQGPLNLAQGRMQELKLGGREHNQNREGYGGRVGPQRVRGRAPVGGSGGRSPLTENGFNSFKTPQTL